MRDDIDVLLVHDSIELTGRYDEDLERQLTHVRTWYSRAPLLLSRPCTSECYEPGGCGRSHRHGGYVTRIPDDSLNLGSEPPEVETDLSGAKRFLDGLLRQSGG